MPLSASGKSGGRLGVLWMALALVVAAFLGAALGLVWQGSDLFGEGKAAEAEAPTVPTSS